LFIKFFSQTKYFTQHEYVGYSFRSLLVWKIATFRRFFNHERKYFRLRYILRLLNTWKMKNSKSGPALIAATGKSLLMIPDEILEEFTNRESLFGVNLYILSEKGKKFPPTYQIIADREGWIKVDKGNFHEFQTNGQELINLKKIKYVIQPNYFENCFENQNTIYIHKNPLSEISRSIGICAPSGLPNLTTFFAIATAIHLGYSPVYVAGLDLDHFRYLSFDGTSTLLNHHAYQENEDDLKWANRETTVKVLNSSLYPMQALVKFKKHKVVILGENSLIDVLPKISIDKLRHSLES
jgi:hypothetical protein